ncbi:transcriptional regulator YeiL [Enterococcus sp. BWM-S5]|uniref:Transcriptional regulator YeiL n=1 Tax=Enterococcus larvae TaxID=2794352 RepID=A0ABS4CKT1_9ENTE|nr:transcriptional regulator YeiL [Enterococcus larvae]MBP1047083.1 transcriptional regulator YeiL [Enterococcus larvae]
MKKTAYPVSTQKNLVAPDSFFTREILAQSWIIEFNGNEFIHKETEKLNHLFYILDGKAKILKNQTNGKRMILQFLGEQDFIGELTLVGAESLTKDVVSIGKTICLALPMTYAAEELMNDLAFVKKLSCYIGEKLLARMEHFTTNQTFELKYRLAELLLTVSVDNSYKEKHTEIAEYLGVSYRHLLYTLKNFRNAGLIEKQGTHYLIDSKKIQQLLAEIR